MTLSYQQYNQVLHKSRLSTDTQKVEMVRRLGARIARAAETFLREAGCNTRGLNSQLNKHNWQKV
jgi:hypothetical protein